MMSNNVGRKLKKAAGITLIEVLVSIVLLGIIIIPFLGMVVQSTKSNTVSKEILDATYVAQECIEKVYSLSNEGNFIDGISALSTEGFIQEDITPNKDFDFKKEVNGYYAIIEIRTTGYSEDLVKVLVKIFDNRHMGTLEAQMETILSWEH